MRAQKIEFKADDKRVGMTVEQLEGFVGAVRDALTTPGAELTAPIFATTGWAGQIRSLTATIGVRDRANP